MTSAKRPDLRAIRDALAALPVLYPAERTWDLIETWIERAPRAGERFGFADLLIGALAAENGRSLCSADADFGRLARLGLIELHQPSGSC